MTTSPPPKKNKFHLTFFFWFLLPEVQNFSLYTSAKNLNPTLTMTKPSMSALDMSHPFLGNLPYPVAWAISPFQSNLYEPLYITRLCLPFMVFIKKCTGWGRGVAWNIKLITFRRISHFHIAIPFRLRNTGVFLLRQRLRISHNKSSHKMD